MLAPRLGLTRGEECEFGSMTATLVMLTRLEHLSMPAMLNTPHEGSGRLIRCPPGCTCMNQRQGCAAGVPGLHSMSNGVQAPVHLAVLMHLDDCRALQKVQPGGLTGGSGC